MSEFNDIFKDLNAAYPGWLSLVERLREGRGKDWPDWPDWCFAPIAGTIAITSNGSLDLSALGLQTALKVTRDADCMAALAAWRYTQGVYRFDTTLLRELVDTPVFDLPAEIFYRLPEWCVYVELGNVLNWRGVFVHLDYDVNDQSAELRLVLDRDGTWDGLTPQGLLLSKSTIKESLTQVCKNAHERLMSAFNQPFLYTADQLETTVAAFAKTLSPIIYLCSVNADMPAVPPNPVPRKTKAGFKLFPPAGPKLWEVGTRIGPALKRAQQQAAAADTASGGTVRPHVRRAHWHHFWKGPRKGERELIVKWLHPILVKVTDSDDLPVTIRPVEGE